LLLVCPHTGECLSTWTWNLNMYVNVVNVDMQFFPNMHVRKKITCWNEIFACQRTKICMSTCKKLQVNMQFLMSTYDFFSGMDFVFKYACSEKNRMFTLKIACQHQKFHVNMWFFSEHAIFSKQHAIFFRTCIVFMLTLDFCMSMSTWDFFRTCIKFFHVNMKTISCQHEIFPEHACWEKISCQHAAPFPDESHTQPCLEPEVRQGRRKGKDHGLWTSKIHLKVVKSVKVLAVRSWPPLHRIPCSSSWAAAARASQRLRYMK
jgi:hypothetical protein